ASRVLGRGVMSETLERRYRKLLRILPQYYRRAREEELLGVLMEGVVEGRRWPEAREALSLARLGVRVRLGEAVRAGGGPDRGDTCGSAGGDAAGGRRHHGALRSTGCPCRTGADRRSARGRVRAGPGPVGPGAGGALGSCSPGR